LELEMLKLEKFLNNIAGGIILTAMMLLVTGDVLGRYLFNRPIHGTTEITEFMMVGLLYFTLAHTQTDKAHIRVEMFITHLSPGTRLILEMIAYLLGFFLFVLITWQGILSAAKAWEVWETTFGLILFPLFPAKVLIPIGSFLFSLRLLLDFIGGLKNLREGSMHDKP
jgi:TRAP-type C4-dicarboxylate transport system permease small subunit